MHAREIENVNTSKIKSIFKKRRRGRDYTHARTRTHTTPYSKELCVKPKSTPDLIVPISATEDYGNCPSGVIPHREKQIKRTENVPR